MTCGELYQKQAEITVVHTTFCASIDVVKGFVANPDPIIPISSISKFRRSINIFTMSKSKDQTILLHGWP